MSDQVKASHGAPGLAAIQDLRLDPENPRIPESHRGNPTPELAKVLERGFDAYAVAQSIAQLGYFSAEPLIVIPNVDEPGTWIVTEGNRRLTALLGLANHSIRVDFTAPEKWEELADMSAVTLEQQVPVVIHQSRDTTHAEIARVHVVGKLPWRPYMQAKYIAARVAEGRTIQEVADLIGIPKSKAADLYRDQAVLNQASELGLETQQVEGAFSLLTVAMSSTKIRDHIGAPLGSRTQVSVDPIPAGKEAELKEVIQWVFGDEDSDAVISDSRQIPQLGNVIASDVGVGALRAGKTLEEAKQSVANAGLDPLTSLSNRLNTARRALSSAADDIAEFAANREIIKIVEDIESIAEGIRTALDEAQENSHDD